MKCPPCEQHDYEAGEDRKLIKKHKCLHYGDDKERLAVVRWVRWPSYDFIFAIPTEGNKYFKDESAFFQYRDHRKGRKGACFYVDKVELKELVAGFTLLLKTSKAITAKEVKALTDKEGKKDGLSLEAQMEIKKFHKGDKTS